MKDLQKRSEFWSEKHTINYNPKDFIQKLLDHNLDVLYNESLDQVKNTNNFMIVAKNK